MTSIDLKDSHEFWKNYADSAVYRVIAIMEPVERWTVDGNPQIEEGIKAISTAFAEAKRFELGQEDKFIKLGCFIKTSRTLRMLQAIDSLEPGSASKLLMYAEERAGNPQDHSSLFIRRNIVFERLRLLSRVFSKDRLALVTKALENEDTI